MRDLDSVYADIRKIPNADDPERTPEVKLLARELNEGEPVLAMAFCDYADRFGCLFATDRRLIYIYKGLLWGSRVESFYYRKLSSISCKCDLLHDTIHLRYGGGKISFKEADMNQAPYLISQVNRCMASSENTVSSEPLLLTDQLERLAALHASGVLSDTEFQAAKDKLLQ